METTDFDAIVIGAGAAGLSAAQALGRSIRRTLVIDAGQPRNRFASHMHNVLGLDGTPPLELLERGRREARTYGVEFLAARVATVRDSGDRLAVTTSADGGSADGDLAPRATALTARALVVATGVTDRLPGIPGLAERWGRTVLHCPYCHGWEVRGARLGVLATSPASMHQAKLIRQWSDDVTVFGAELGELDAADERALRARGIRVEPDPVASVTSGAAAEMLVTTTGGASHSIDAIFTASRLQAHDDFLSGLELDRAESPFGSFLTVDPMGRTSHPRIWAAGNVVAPMATVPMAMGAGAGAGGAVNFALVEEDFSDAVAASEAGRA
ncbi:NAD(P)/FAD-dependent oxidoreductase [Leucobacter aridicollis]|uniref:NAD(P)/FAD-dependent oxidoreductase n=1 Tax=Leucobacter aridicollis TaxID=283878 RepID=UPI002104C94E|nr:NAD(P)/FAD-dependent oxidoreductase [Leucobacter aridicollis]UTX52818.1 NAD(P)/FAD-dependent oxidoreductase [Leucobacter aridicollis]